MATKLDGLRKKLGKPLTKLEQLDEDGLLAAPVDIQAQFQHGMIEADAPTDEARKGTVIDGAVKVATWNVIAPVWVLGDVVADSIHLTADLVITGSLTVTGDVHGQWEPNTLTVLGTVTLGRAIMEGQFIMQFLGGGRIVELIDDEGGADELIELMKQAGSTLKVKRSAKLPGK